MSQPLRTEADVFKDLNLSKDEITKFEKAFKDPKFLELFSEYAKEVSDPKAREENDLYLRQLESQGKAEEVYGKGVQLIVPNAGFVLKCRTKDANKKLFINVCTSEKMEIHRLENATGPDGSPGRMMHIPFTLSQLKEGSDKKGNSCSVVDFVVNPETKDFSFKNRNVMQLLSDTAMDAVEKRDGLILDRRFTIPKIKYKGTESCPKPHVLSIRTDGSSSEPGARIPPKSEYDGAGFLDPDSVKAQGARKDGDSSNDGNNNSSGGKENSSNSNIISHSKPEASANRNSNENNNDNNISGSGNKRSSFSFPASKTTTKAPYPTSAPHAIPPSPKAPLEPGFIHPGGEETPSYDVVHRGIQDMAAAWADAGKGLQVDFSTPKELVVRVKMPGVSSAAAAELDIGIKSLSLKVPGMFALDLPLPYKVDDAKGKAKYDKAKQVLEITLPVVPPPPPPPAPTRKSRDLGLFPEEETTTEEGEKEEEKVKKEEETVKKEEEKVKKEEEKVEKEEEQEEKEKELTKNERKWRDLYAEREREEAERRLELEKDKAAKAEEVAAAKAEEEEQAKKGGKGEKKGKEPVAYTPTYLKPRLNRSFAEEL